MWFRFKFFSLRSETKRKEIRFAFVSQSFRLFNWKIQFFRFYSLLFTSIFRFTWKQTKKSYFFTFFSLPFSWMAVQAGLQRPQSLEAFRGPPEGNGTVPHHRLPPWKFEWLVLTLVTKKNKALITNVIVVYSFTESLKRSYYISCFFTVVLQLECSHWIIYFLARSRKIQTLR